MNLYYLYTSDVALRDNKVIQKTEKVYGQGPYVYLDTTLTSWATACTDTTATVRAQVATLECSGACVSALSEAQPRCLLPHDKTSLEPSRPRGS